MTSVPSHARVSVPHHIQSIYLIAICGTAMGSLAGMLKERGYKIRGSDSAVYPPMSTALQDAGIPILEGFKPDHLHPRPDLVVIGNAVSQNNPEVEIVLKEKIPYLSLPEALAQFFLTDRVPIVITGTHGKTTTTALTAWLLESAGLCPSFFVGGITHNFSRSYQLSSGKHFVIEGDEYDSAFFDKGPKFFHYKPEIAAITSLEFDHADIYADIASIEKNFAKFSELLPPTGQLFYCSHYPNILPLIESSPATHTSYGLKGSEAISATEIDHHDGGTRFTLKQHGTHCGIWQSPLSGNHNLLNVLAAIGIVSALGVAPDQIRAGLSQFKGVKRRQEIRGVVRGITVIDDFAHHPTAVRETIAAVRKCFPNGKLWAIFEPRSNTSIRAVFQKDYAKSFEGADRICLAPVFKPEKVKDAHILDLDAVVKHLNQWGNRAKRYQNVEGIIQDVGRDAKSGDTILIMSNGGFENIHERLLQAMALSRS